MQHTRSSLWHAGSLVVAVGNLLVAACKLLVVVCGIYFPDQGSNLGPLHWEHGVLAIGPPGKSIKKTFLILQYSTLKSTVVLATSLLLLCLLPDILGLK